MFCLILLKKQQSLKKGKPQILFPFQKRSSEIPWRFDNSSRSLEKLAHSDNVSKSTLPDSLGIKGTTK